MGTADCSLGKRSDRGQRENAVRWPGSDHAVVWPSRCLGATAVLYVERVTSADPIETERLGRLRSTMTEMGVPAVLTADPINIAYATGLRNMTIYSMMGAVRFLLVIANGPAVMWEFDGAEHLARHHITIDEVRTAPGITAHAGPAYVENAAVFAREVTALCRRWSGDSAVLGVERMDHPVTDAFRSAGLTLADATAVFIRSRILKTECEVRVMREAMNRVTAGVELMKSGLEPGRTEVEVWAELHRHLVGTDGEYISTRLAQAGHRTFPYFNEASSAIVENGDLFCIDTDAIGYGGYGVDFSRTYICGDAQPSPTQRNVHQMALEQLSHNAALLRAGRSFENFARLAWQVPSRFHPYRYSCLAHGLGMSGEYPYVPIHVDHQPFPLPGVFEPGMVICVESYIGDPDTSEGAKLEDQYLITDTGAERMSTTPFDPAFGA